MPGGDTIGISLSVLVTGMSVGGLLVLVVRFQPGDVKLLGIQAKGWMALGRKALGIIVNPYMRSVIRMRTVIILVIGDMF